MSSYRWRSMGSDLTYYANAWPAYDSPCVACGTGCRPIDRFCSQCGQADPLGPRDETPFLFDDELATSATIIAEDSDEMRPDATIVGASPSPPAVQGSGDDIENGATAISHANIPLRSRKRTAEAVAALERA